MRGLRLGVRLKFYGHCWMLRLGNNEIMNTNVVVVVVGGRRVPSWHESG